MSISANALFLFILQREVDEELATWVASVYSGKWTRTDWFAYALCVGGLVVVWGGGIVAFILGIILG